LKCALGHEKSLLLVGSMALGQTKSINDAGQRGKRGEEVAMGKRLHSPIEPYRWGRAARGRAPF